MKVTIYTINNDAFCTAEKEYLTAHNIAFEEKNIEADPKLRDEMKTVSDDFAGVPFSTVEKDDGTTVNLKGFTKEEFDNVLGMESTAPAVAEKVEEPKLEPAPVVAAPEPVVSAQEPVEMPATPAEVAAPTVAPTPPAETGTDEKLDNVLSQLSSLSDLSSATPPTGGPAVPSDQTTASVPTPSAPTEQAIPQPADPATAPTTAATDSAVPEIPDFSK